MRHVARMGKENAYKVLVVKPEALGKPRRRFVWCAIGTRGQHSYTR